MKTYKYCVHAVIAWTFLVAQCIAQGTGHQDMWARWRFLIGDWVGIGSGDPGRGEGAFSFLPDLNNKILVRKSYSEYPPKPGEKVGIRHEDLMIVYPSEEGSTFRADYFDNEGHIIHYEVTFPAKQAAVVFESEQKAAQPRYRLDYEMGANDEVQITFSIAPPGQPYKTYLQGKSKRKG
ncbi:MAG TPA: hypothetical protein VE398_14775 [Acidobacteriota bacterium]|nr:hypothetical protein [Acidobacteriota bacterium]